MHGGSANTAGFQNRCRASLTGCSIGHSWDRAGLVGRKTAVPITVRKRGGQSPKLTRPGTILVREWQGTTHQVPVRADGFLWNGRAHNSLSGIARAITGTKWNGPRFFGMREPNDAL